MQKCQVIYYMVFINKLLLYKSFLFYQTDMTKSVEMEHLYS